MTRAHTQRTRRVQRARAAPAAARRALRLRSVALAAWREHARDERGFAAVWMITVTFVVSLIVGLLVDGSARMSAIQEADHAAAEAARAGAQALPRATVQARTVAAGSSGAEAVAAAQSYLAAVRVPGSVVIDAAGSLRVSTSLSWSPVFLSAVGVRSSVVEGRAVVSLVQSVEGVPS